MGVIRGRGGQPTSEDRQPARWKDLLARPEGANLMGSYRVRLKATILFPVMTKCSELPDKAMGNPKGCATPSWSVSPSATVLH